MNRIISHLAAAYIGAGLSLGLVMAQVLPLTVVGVLIYAVTWPQLAELLAQHEGGCHHG